MQVFTSEGSAESFPRSPSLVLSWKRSVQLLMSTYLVSELWSTPERKGSENTGNFTATWRWLRRMPHHPALFSQTLAGDLVVCRWSWTISLHTRGYVSSSCDHETLLVSRLDMVLALERTGRHQALCVYYRIIVIQTPVLPLKIARSFIFHLQICKDFRIRDRFIQSQLSQTCYMYKEIELFIPL